MKYLRQNIRVLRFSFGVIALLAIIAQFFVSSQNPEFNIVNFFSCFTFLSNLFAVLVLIYTAFNRNDFLRGANTLYLLVTAVVYVILVKSSNLQSPYFVPILDNIHHIIIPLAALIDWIITPSMKFKFQEILYWLVFPIVYIIYTLVRGRLINWYPYDFLIPKGNNYTSVFSFVFLIGVGIIIMAIFIANIRRLKIYEK